MKKQPHPPLTPTYISYVEPQSYPLKFNNPLALRVGQSHLQRRLMEGQPEARNAYCHFPTLSDGIIQGVLLLMHYHAAGEQSLHKLFNRWPMRYPSLRDNIVRMLARQLMITPHQPFMLTTHNAAVILALLCHHETGYNIPPSSIVTLIES